MVSVSKVLHSAANTASSAASGVANFAKSVGQYALMSRATPAPKPFFLNPLNHGITDSVFHAADKHGFSTTLYKTFLIASLALPLLAVLEFIVVNPLRLTAGNLLTLANRAYTHHNNKDIQYKPSLLKISFVALTLLGLSAYKFGFWPFNASTAPVVPTPETTVTPVAEGYSTTTKVVGGATILAVLGGLGVIGKKCAEKWLPEHDATANASAQHGTQNGSGTGATAFGSANNTAHKD